MIKKTFHVVIVAVLALNLMGAWAFAAAFDCGMECCKPGNWAGTVSYEAPSCCQMDEVTCGFETGKYEEIFDTAICCFDSTQKISGVWDLTATSYIFSPSPTLPLPPSEGSTSSYQGTPLYLSNSTLLC